MSSLNLYRLVHQKWAAQAFDGEGARLCGGRWNSKGRSCVYTAGSEALAILELLVHLNNRVALKHYQLFQLRINTEQLLTLSSANLPLSWRQQPASGETARIGDNWLQTRSSLALAVPSVIAPREQNILLNPQHPDYNALIKGASALDFMPDSRLL
jgi:RES domain-containing protein